MARLGRYMLIAGVLCHLAAADAATAVALRTENGPPEKLIISGETYTMVVNCTAAVIERFTAGDQDLIGEVPLCPTINTSKPDGPATVAVPQNGPVFAEVHLANLRWPDLDADIEIVLYCYRTRVYATAIVAPRGAVPDMMVGWYGGVKYSMPLEMRSEQELQTMASFNGQDPKCAAVVAEPWIQFGLFGKKLKSVINFRNSIGRISGGYGYRSAYTCPRRASILLLACQSNEELKGALRGEAALSFARIDVRGGAFARYDGSKGFFKFEHGDKDAGELAIDVTLDRPPPQKPPVPTLMQRAAMAASKVDWKAGSLLFFLLATVIFGYRAQPRPNTLAARLRPKVLATAAAIALLTAVVLLFRLPPPPGPSVMPLPHGPVRAVFSVAGATDAAPLAPVGGPAPAGAIQTRTGPDGQPETWFEVPIDPVATNTYVLRGPETPSARVTDGAAVH